MKKNILLFSMLLFIACEKAEEGGGTPPVDHLSWESSHVSLHHLKGKVKQLRRVRFYNYDLTTEVAQDSSISILRFDEYGRVVFYDPQGMSEKRQIMSSLSQQKRSAIATYGVYEYRYNSNGDLLEIEVSTPFNDSKQIYSYTYGTHTNYVPSFIPVGELETFSKKGIVKISNASEILYEWKDNKMVSEVHEEGTILFTENSFENNNLSLQTSLLMLGADTLSLIATRYTYMPNGGMLNSVREIKTKYSHELIKTNYLTSGWNNPTVVNTFEMNDGVETLTLRSEWAYSEQNWLLQQKDIYPSDEGANETIFQQFKYLTFDAYGNWVSASALVKSPWGLESQNVIYKQDITYFK